METAPKFGPCLRLHGQGGKNASGHWPGFFQHPVKKGTIQTAAVHLHRAAEDALTTLVQAPLNKPWMHHFPPRIIGSTLEYRGGNFGTHTKTSRGVNGTDNFRSESASVFKDMVCNSSNPVDTDIVHADIRWVWYCYYSADTDYPPFLMDYLIFFIRIIRFAYLKISPSIRLVPKFPSLYTDYNPTYYIIIAFL
jgi:hypothetical protein